MKELIKKIAFTLLFLGISSLSYASVWSLWENEDEELNFSKGLGRRFISSEVSPKIKSSGSINIKAKSEPIKVKASSFNLGNKKTYTVGQNYVAYDYELEDNTNVSDREIYNSINKWKNGLVSVFWENYRGNNIRVEILRNSRDLREMRLKFVQSQDMISDPDGSISDMLNVVANQVMKRTCGKKAKQSIILYERPAVELEKETAADEYKIMAIGSSIKEYGYRCIY